VNEITQAFVLGAGLGTRLRPLTDDLPKPLIPVFQKPLITFALDHLIDAGVTTFVINTHRLPERFQDFFPENSYAGQSITLVHERDLLNTGGGMKNVEPFLGGKPFIAYSGDILSDVNLEPLLANHFRAENDVTLSLRRNTGLGAGVVMRRDRIVAIVNDSNPEENFDYANISVWNPDIFSKLPPGQKVSFIPILAKWISQGGKIGGVVLDDGRWFNIGSRKEYLKVHRTIFQEKWKPRYVRDTGWPERVAKTATVDPTAQLRGCTVIGGDCRVGPNAILEDTILWPGSEIASQTHLDGCIVRARKKVSGIHRDIDI
jgi:mannose-1-phosphate guanylyltransferase